MSMRARFGRRTRQRPALRGAGARRSSFVRALACLLVFLGLGAPLLEAAHQVAVEHVVCPVHGELVHAEHGDGAHASAVAEASDRPASTTAASCPAPASTLTAACIGPT